MRRIVFAALSIILSILPDSTHQSDVKLVEIQDCRSLTDGIYSDPNDCHRYFHCSGSKTFYFRCYDGFVFDPCELRCKLRDVCIPAEFCNKNLLQNLTLIPTTTESLTTGKKRVSNVVAAADVAKLNEIQNDDVTPSSLNNRRRLTGSRSIIPPYSKPFENQYESRLNEINNRLGDGNDDLLFRNTPSAPLEVGGSSRGSVEGSFDLSAGSGAQTTTERLKLAVVRNFNSAESASGLVEKLKTAFTSNVDDSTESFSSHTGYKTSTRSDDPEVWKTTTKATVTTSTSVDSFAEKISTQSATTTSASPAFRPVVTTAGSSDAPLTYIVKVVFSRRTKPEGKGDSSASREFLQAEQSKSTENNTFVTTATTDDANAATNATNNTNAENFARINVVETIGNKENSSNLTPLNNALAVTTTKSPSSSTTINETSQGADPDANNGSISSSLKSNVSSATDSSPTSVRRVVTPLSTISAESTTTVASTTTASTLDVITRDIGVDNSSALSQTKDNESDTTREATFIRVTSDILTVTLSTAPRQIQGNFSAEDLSVMNNITLSCNPTISSALCEKSDNESREALARHCQDLTCNNGGMFISLSNGHCGCVCQTGYKGDACSELIDRQLCRCQNGGRCVDVGNETYACRCPLGFFGDKCQYPVDDLQSKSSNLLDFPLPGPKFASKLVMELNKYLLCVVNICANGGICLKEIESGASQCFCGHNFAGRYCEKKCINC